ALNLGGQGLADSAKSIVTIKRDTLLLRKKIFVRMRVCVLSHYHNRKGATLLFTLQQQITNARQAKGMSGDENNVSAAGDAAVGRDPAGMTAHHFDDHHAVMRLSR